MQADDTCKTEEWVGRVREHREGKCSNKCGDAMLSVHHEMYLQLSSML